MRIYMKKIFGIAVLSAVLFSTAGASIWETIEWDIVTTVEIMPISADITKEIKFYRDGITPKTYSSLDELLKNETNVTSVTDGCNGGFVMPDGNVAMTLMYCENIYGENGQEIWSRTDTLLPVYGDNATYFDEALFQKLDKNSKLHAKLELVLSKRSESQLEKVLMNIDQQIETVKLTRIAKFAQDERITSLLFLKVVIQDLK